MNVSTTRICRVWSGGKLRWAILEPRQPSTSLKLSSETSWRETEQAAVVVGSLGSCQPLFLCYNRITQSQGCVARSGCTFITTSCLQPSPEASRGWTRPIGKDRRQASNWLHCRLCNDCEGYCFLKFSQATQIQETPGGTAAITGLSRSHIKSKQSQCWHADTFLLLQLAHVDVATRPSLFSESQSRCGYSSLLLLCSSF